MSPYPVQEVGDYRADDQRPSDAGPLPEQRRQKVGERGLQVSDEAGHAERK